MFKITEKEKRKWALRNSRVTRWADAMGLSWMGAWWRCLHKGPRGRRDEERKEERRLNNGKS